jgi:hypothetical protein
MPKAPPSLLAERIHAGAPPFELSWLGGAPERYFRRVRPGVDDMPWGTLQAERYPALLVDRARIAWTEAALNEYCTAIAFAEMLKWMLIARAPVDLVGMASDFVADEILHVELTSRVAMELGGGAPFRVQPENVLVGSTPDLDPLQSANEWVVKLCCVGEAFSVPMLSGAMSAAAHPLTRAVLTRIVQDEAPHGHFGWHYLDWAADLIEEPERLRLAKVAAATLRTLSPLWQRLRSVVKDGETSEGFLLAHVNELGWMDSESYGRRAREAVLDRVVTPLAQYGIAIAPEDVADVLA